MGDNGLLNDVYTRVSQENLRLVHIWVDNIVFSWRWWVSVLLAIIPWILWIKFRDKRDTARLLFAGMIAAVISHILDVVGLCFGLWHYDWKIFPCLPMYFPWDFTLFPIGVMVLLQFKRHINAWVKAVVFAFASAFIFEPIFSLLGMYHNIHWEYWYSFIIYVPLYLFYHYIYVSRMWKRHNDL